MGKLVPNIFGAAWARHLRPMSDLGGYEPVLLKLDQTGPGPTRPMNPHISRGRITEGFLAKEWITTWGGYGYPNPIIK